MLGRVLILVYINHVTDDVGASYKAFADDYKRCLRYKMEGNFAIAGVSSLGVSPWQYFFGVIILELKVIYR